VHYIINRGKSGVFHLGSNDLTHQHDLITDIAETLGYKNPLLKQVYDSNFDRFLAVLPKDNFCQKPTGICSGCSESFSLGIAVNHSQ
jgi:hypothetical protein